MPLMPGMSMNSYPPAIAIALFYRACLVIGVALVLTLLVLRFGTDVGRDGPGRRGSSPLRERLAYWLGALGLIDGLLQAQPLMVARFFGGLLAPLVQGQPAPVAAIVQLGTHLRALSPIWFKVGATYIQLLIGVALLFSRSAAVQRAALWVSIVWGLAVRAAGEAFGGLFVAAGPLVGSPGSVRAPADHITVVGSFGTWRWHPGQGWSRYG